MHTTPAIAIHLDPNKPTGQTLITALAAIGVSCEPIALPMPARPLDPFVLDGLDAVRDRCAE